MYRQGSGAEMFDAPQVVVAGASGAYRRLDLAERRGGMRVGGSDQARSDARQAPGTCWAAIAFGSLTAAPPPDCLPTEQDGSSSAVGWSGARSIAITVERRAAGGGVETVAVLDVDVRDGSTRQVSVIPCGAAT